MCHQIKADEIERIMRTTTGNINVNNDIINDNSSPICLLNPSQRMCYKMMMTFAERLPTAELLPDWECNIRSLVSEKLKKKYHQSFEYHMNDIKDYYRQQIHEISVKSVIISEYNSGNIDELYYKFDGRTIYRERYLKNRNKMALKYNHSHKLISNILSNGYSLMPGFICYAENYRQYGFIEPTKFFDDFEADIQIGALTITNTYYKHIVTLITNKKYIAEVPINLLENLIKCATKLMSYQIINNLINSIEHTLDVLDNWLIRPLFKLELKCESNDLFIYPARNTFISRCHVILDKISCSGLHLTPLEFSINIKTNNEFISVIIPEWFMEKSHRRLDIVMVELWESLDIYIKNIREKFAIIYSESTRDKIAIFVENNQSFKDCVDKVDEFNRYIQEIDGLAENEYLTIGQIYLGNAKKQLKEYASMIREHIIQELLKRQRKFNLNICYTFEEITKRILNIPDTTKELLELGEFITYATTTFMDEMREKINLTLFKMVCFIDITTLSSDDIELNKITVNWMSKIKPIFEQCNLLHEQKKFDLEEQLQNKIVDLNNKVDGIFSRLVIMNNMDDVNRIREYIEDMRNLMCCLDRIDEQSVEINDEEELFRFPLTLYPKIQELKNEVNPYYNLIYKGLKWQRDSNLWLDGPFEYLEVSTIEDRTLDYYAEFNKIFKLYKTKIKMQIATGCPYVFTGSIDDPDPQQQPAPLKLTTQLLDSVKWFKAYIPLVNCFCNPALRQRHWNEMSMISNFDLTPDAGTTLRKIIHKDLMKDLDKYETISVSASKELTLNESLKKIMNDWDNVMFNIVQHKDSGMTILTKLDEIQSILEDHIVKIQSMRGSAFVKPIENEVKIFYEFLLRIQKTIDEWTRVQIGWIYLSPIFSSKDIVRQLPEEGVMFHNINNIFKKAMQAVLHDRRVKETAGTHGLYESMKEANELMEKVHQGVFNYLEDKRLYFPRFFFLSNDDMLGILSETKNPLRVQPHLRKCFEGIAKLGFNKQLEIYSMFGDDNEEIKMQGIISTSDANGCVERWLIQVEEQMVNSIKYEIMMSYFDYESTKRIKWVLIWPGQVVLCVSQIHWNLTVQKCLMTHSISTLELLHRDLKNQMIDMVNLIKGKLTIQNRITLNALITIDVHAQDIVKLLIDKGITDETDFEWIAQLRYYWEDNAVVRIINATVPYAYEYLGNCPRLVITPLTDRCYRTLIGAYSLHLNGAPEGPAGTGKTETTKDLARAIAVQCIVFNCSEGLDYKNMGKFFKGLACCGAWACFDEFNRIELEVLSVVAQQILTIIQAVRGHMKTFIFDGTELNLNPAVYICITMNPGYAGRSELPDNLKVLFRTVAMMVPDYAMIGEIFLYSSGFTTARALSIKIVTTYKLCSEQLSSQSHYDYGMRAVKSVLTAAQNYKLKYPNDDETILLLRSIIDVNLPKFLTHDIPLFQGIITDLFPKINIPTSNYNTFLRAVEIIANQRNLQIVDGFLLKIIQTYEMMIVRHGFMVVGEPFGGKTSILHTLADALTLMEEWNDNMGVKTIYTTINPKSVTIGQLYGQFDTVSSEWHDGICPVAFREYCIDVSRSRKWLIFDGPVDAVWIENLNTVLDDNKKLCLTSGEVIQMTNVMSMIFETMDLLQASPATVSRCGMIYIEPQILSWRPFIDSWLNTLNPKWSKNHLGMINDLFNWHLDECLNFIRKQCNISLNGGQMNQIVSTLNLFEIYLNDAVDDSDDYDENIVYWIQAAMILAMVWGIGGALDHDSREKFDDFYINIWRNKFEYLPMPESVSINLISLPNDGIIHDNYYTFKGKGAWKNYGDTVKMEDFIKTQNIREIIIPTIDTIKYQSIIGKFIKHRKRFLLYGNTGTGKSFYIKDMMNKLNEDEYLANSITFTARTTASIAQELVISKLFKRQKGHYGPINGSHCIIFIDNVNMPAKEIYGAQSAIELLRQVFDHGHWYDLKEPEKIQIYDTMFLCAMSPPGGSRQEIYQRFLRHFNLLSINNFSDESIFRIYTNLALIGFKHQGFSISDVNTIVNNIVNATLNIFKRVVADLRPTPNKSHYLFNLRDFSRVITGCTMIKKESIESKITFTRLWVHEILRVFGDRLIDVTDREWLHYQLNDTMKIIMKESIDTVFDNLPKYNDQITELSLSNLIFGNFMDLDVNIVNDRKYEEIKSIEELKLIVMHCIEHYNEINKNKMDIVPFCYALIHLSRICRILSMPGGNLLMVGFSGSGRQSLTRLAANMANYSIFQPEIGSAYGINEWREDIKGVLKNSGGIGKDLVFLFTEGQIKDDEFLSDIDSLLNSGEIPNLFDIEERQEVIEMCRMAAQGGNRNLDISISSILSFFVNRCKDKLHLMLCFSPIDESFSKRLRLYPSLIDCCTIDWFEIWPEDALEEVAIKFIGDINLNDKLKLNAIIACKYFHICAKEMCLNFYNSSGRMTYVTTSAFLDLIKIYRNLITDKQNDITIARNRYLNGLDKLAFAADEITKMKLTLEQLKPQLERSAKLTAETMEKIEYENVLVENATILVKKDEDAANLQAKITGGLKAECAEDLAAALPVLEEALVALDILKPADISLVKTMKNPPRGVKLVMAAICVMLNVPPVKVIDPDTGDTVIDYWQASKKILNDIKFLDNLRNYDKDNIPTNIIQNIEKNYLADENFQPAIIAKASQAAEGLCKWVRAMILYDKAIKDVAPKKEKLAAAVKDYEDTMILLNSKRQMLKELNDKLTILKENLQSTLVKKIDLENQVENCSNKLIRATKLINGLGGEKDRWLQTAKDLQNSYDTLPGDILICCGIIAYLGPYTTLYRIENVEKWRLHVNYLNIPCSNSFDFIKILGTEIKINSWNIFGLPRDLFSTENAIIMSNSKRWSLFIDPQSQACKWIKKMEKICELEIVKLTDKNYMNIIEQCIEYGKPVLIENIDDKLDTSLDPILFKSIYKIANEWYITLGDKIQQYNKQFRLYMTTKLRNPHYSPEIFNKVTVINFSLTIDGLEDQLLGIVVAKERPDLQKKREYLIVEAAENKKALKQVEDNILQTLSNSGKEILEDEEATAILDSSKILSIDIIKKQVSSKETENKIDGFRQSYRPIAKHSSSLYYTLIDLPNIDPMYEYSLTWFINLYVIAIDSANKSKMLDRRLMFLRDTFTYILYENVSRSLFQKDKLLYSFILYTTILLATNIIDKDELMFLLSGGIDAIGQCDNNPASEWLSDKCWIEINRVAQLKTFKNFPEDFCNNVNEWRNFYNLLNPEKSLIPQPWENNLTKFQKLIIIKMIRPDKVILKIMEFIEDGMGQKYINSPSFDISKSYSDSNCIIPLIFILSPGSDPMSALTNFVNKTESSTQFYSMSLGQGQGPIAQKLIEKAQIDGSWVCLQNCHLAVSWMPMLEKICENFHTTNTSINFRLWLTSYPTDKFPISVLQNSIKMTNEPPMGLQQNLIRSYTSEPIKNPEFFSGCPGKERSFTKLLYGLCFFHAVIQERKNYNSQGWNIRYNFDESDFQISAHQLQIFINDYKDIPFKALLYLTGECNYGGRVTDDRDRRCLMTIIQDFYNKNIIDDPNYCFSSVNTEYTLPKKIEYRDYIKHIEAIPINPPVDVFGLHSNAGIIRDLEINRKFFDSMMIIHGSITIGDTSKYDLLLTMKKNIYEKLPDLFDIEEAEMLYPITYMESMNTVLIQELTRYNILLREIRHSLNMLDNALMGLIVMTTDLEILSRYIINGKIPPTWIKASSYPTLKPLSSFIIDLLRRLEYFQLWLNNGKPKTFWISGFSFIHAFLTGAMQNFARKYELSIDKIDFDFQMMPVYKSNVDPIDGVYTYGTYLIGGRWDIKTMTLEESHEKIICESMPIVWFKPSEITMINIIKRYECPLYITSERCGTLKTTGHSTNYILMILLDTKLPISHWIKRGLALLCQLDD